MTRAVAAWSAGERAAGRVHGLTGNDPGPQPEFRAHDNSACWSGGALRVAADLGAGKTVVTMLADTGERYLSHPLYTELS